MAITTIDKRGVIALNIKDNKKFKTGVFNNREYYTDIYTDGTIIDTRVIYRGKTNGLYKPDGVFSDYFNEAELTKTRVIVKNASYIINVLRSKNNLYGNNYNYIERVDIQMKDTNDKKLYENVEDILVLLNDETYNLDSTDHKLTLK